MLGDIVRTALALNIVSVALVASVASAMAENATRELTTILSDSDKSILDIHLGKTSLQQVQEIIGDAKPLPRQEHAPLQICYVSETGRTVIYFEAGPMGGWDVVTAFTLAQTRGGQTGRCSKTDRVTDQVATESGITLGMTKREIINKFGHPATQDANEISYINETQANDVRSDGPDSPPFYITESIQAVFDESGLTSITISCIESD